jgi:hypothetical protein
MTAIDQKFQIMESLDSLDHAQAKEVLDYIKRLQVKSVQDSQREQKVKREAMIQIRLALTKGRTLNPSF